MVSEGCPPTVAALLPGLSELVCDLGLGTRLVARSHECDAAPELAQLPALTHSKLIPVASSQQGTDPVEIAALSAFEISAGWRTVTAKDAFACSAENRVSERLCSYYAVSVQGLICAAPTVLLTHVQPARSSLEPSEDEICDVFRCLSPATTAVVSLDPSTVAEVCAAAHAIARALRAPSAALRAVEKTRKRLANVLQYSVTARSGTAPRRPRVAVVQWTDPVYLAGAWIPEVIDAAGGESLFCRPGGPSIPVEPSDLRAADVIVVTLCAMHIEEAEKLTRKLWQAHGDTLASCRARIVIVDAMRLFSRPSLSAVADSAECMAEIIANAHPFGHEKYWKNWIQPNAPTDYTRPLHVPKRLSCERTRVPTCR